MAGSMFAGLNVNVLRMFVRVVETGNVSAAARSLYLAQSAVSAQLSSLSRNVGYPLLERSSGRWHATAQGGIFYEAALRILKTVDDLERNIVESSSRYAGRFALASTRTVSDTILARVLQSFGRSYPEIRVEVFSGDKHDVERRLAGDEADAALVALPLSLRDLDVFEFDEDEVVAVLDAAHPLAGRPTLRFDEIALERFVMFAPGSGVRSLLEERIGARFATLAIELDLTSNDAIVSAVEAGLGVAFLPRRTARRWSEGGTICFASIEDVDLKRPLALVCRANRTLAPAALKFKEWLIASRQESVPTTDADVIAGSDGRSHRSV